MRDWLKSNRLLNGFTMKDLADKLDISESYYSMIENGERQKKMDITLVTRLSVVLGIPIQRIVELEEELAKKN